MFFENYFTPYLRRVTYNDIVFSDESDLEVYRIKDESLTLIIHKIIWYSPEKSKYLHIISVEDGNLNVKYTNFDEGLKELEGLGLKLTADFWA
jgi:hypothetical protein